MTRVEFHMNNSEVFATSLPDAHVEMIRAALGNAKTRTLTVSGTPEAILVINNIAFVTIGNAE